MSEFSTAGSAVLQRLLGEVSLANFCNEYFSRMPFTLPGAASEFQELGSWSTVESIMAQPEADMLVVRQGRRWNGASSPTFNEARQLFNQGYTILVRHAERHDVRLRELADAFTHDFRAPVDIHIYCTPAEEHGFGWHYDAEDVFILQTQGTKEYSLRKNTVNPWPIEEMLPQDMKFERELMPLMKCLLQAGDWLYIPNGYWHVAQAKEPAISLAVGVMTTTGVDVFDFLRRRVLSSMLWRQRIPFAGAAWELSSDEVLEQYRSICAELADDLAKTLQDETFLRSFLFEKDTDD